MIVSRPPVEQESGTAVRLRIEVRGAVQGVGFRPFVYRLATGLGLAGWVANNPRGAVLEVESHRERLDAFLTRLEQERPAPASIRNVEVVAVLPVGEMGFRIRESDTAGERTAWAIPDLATCAACLREVLNPADRRYRYPFANCAECGPRFSILRALPYDRPNTSMAGFPMCAACREEYKDPGDRRFHAQPIACPQCGPQLALWDDAGRSAAAGDDALLLAAAAIRQGKIVAVKGLGGFHLVVDAASEETVRCLRERKQREEKPFALMVPSLACVRQVCKVSDAEERLLLSPEAPIVLLKRLSTGDRTSPTHPHTHTSDCGLGTPPPQHPHSHPAPAVAPDNPYLGVMLPYTPLHHLLMAAVGRPVVATSGNRADEPICTDERQALSRLRGIADLFLVHDRPIVRPVDDSVVRIGAGRPLLLRRARGYAPLPIPVSRPLLPALGCGAHLKSTVAVSSGTQVFLSQHIGDLETAEACDALRRAAGDLAGLYGIRPGAVACDMHPDYQSTRFAEETARDPGGPLPVLRVQHHHAHVLACAAENGLEGPLLGVAWDGTGLGPDGTAWGGEFLRVDGAAWERIARLRPFRLPGGDRAAREPRRSALGLLFELFGPNLFERGDFPPVASLGGQEAAVFRRMLQAGLNAPFTSSAGRLFDAAASLMGLRQRCGYEGQAAAALEFALEGVREEGSYPFDKSDEVLDWAPMMVALLADRGRGVPIGVISARFHNTLVEMILAVARAAGEERVALAGGCFQNRYLLERAVIRLRAAGLQPFWPRLVPPNDGAIALGQVMILSPKS